MNYLSRNYKPKLIDSFLFFNEFDLLKTRLEYYGSSVDHFVIAECDVDFSGKKKGYLLNKDSIQTLPFSEKILLCQAQLDFNSLQWLYKKFRYKNDRKKFLWKIQDFQRNLLMKELKKFSENDVIIFGDLDEFPNHEAISNFLRGGDLEIIVCDQIMFYYNLSIIIDNEDWNGSLIFKRKLLNEFKLHYLRSQRNNFPIIKNAGWHFSYFMRPEFIREKILSIADVENLSKYKSIELNEIINKINIAQDLYGRNMNFKIVDPSNLLIDVNLIHLINKNMPYLKKNTG